MSAATPLLEDAPLELDFTSEEALFAAWAQVVAQGGLYVPGLKLTDDERLAVSFCTPTRRFDGQEARRLETASPLGSTGAWVELTPSEDFRLELERRAWLGRPLRPDSRRANPRFATALAVSFHNSPKDLRRLATDLSRNGLFVRCDAPPAIGVQLTVHLTLPSGSVIALETEVRNRILSGPDVGVGLRILPSTAQLAELHAFLNQLAARKPQVLVIDDEAIWRHTLDRTLTSLGAEVRFAKDGREGMRALIDAYFDLDLVIVDLHMPHIDGVGLLERVRALGNDKALTILLLTAADPADVANSRAPQLANVVLSKLDPLETITARIAESLAALVQRPS